MTNKVVLLADSHFGARAESPVFLNYFAQFYKEVFFPYLDKHKIKTVIHLGDLVDRRKYISYTTSNTLRTSYIMPSIMNDITTYIIAGNHDCFYKTTND